jgi:hypothetical protein
MMNRTLPVLVAAAIVAGCGSESSLPEASGEGTVRMINAMPASPTVSFLIEERTLDTVSYKNSSSPDRWDGLEYTFNFQISQPSQVQPTRIASQPLNVERDVEHTFVLRGSIDAPTVDTWEIQERSFSGDETIFEMRVGHAADGLGAVDVYVGQEGVPPQPGDQVASLAPGEVSAPRDIAEDDYVVTVTPAGDAGNVLFQSTPTQIVASQSVLITVLQGDANDTAPVAVRIFNQAGTSATLADSRFLPTARFVHATTDLGTADIYDDAGLQNRIVANLAYGDITADIEVPAGDVPITATAAGNVGAILFEDTVTTINGARVNYYLSKLAGDIVGEPVRVDRRSIETVARLTFFHSAANNRSVDLYVVDAGTAIDEALPRQAGQGYLQQTSPLALDAGSYDIYVTTSGEKTVLEGPLSLEASYGDVFEAVLLDRVDPSLAELRLFPPP